MSEIPTLINGENVTRPDEPVLVGVAPGEAERREKRAQEIIGTTRLGLLKRENQRLRKQLQEMEAKLGEREEALAEAREEGHKEGLAAGREAGREEARQEARELVNTLEDLLMQTREQLAGQQKVLAEAVVSLAENLARRVVGEVLQLRRDLLEKIIGDFLAEFLERGPFVVRLHPADLAALRKLGAEERLGAAGAVLEEGPEIARYQCRVEFAQGMTLLGEEQVRVLAAGLKEALELKNVE